MEFSDLPELWALHARYAERWTFAYPGLEIDREVLRMSEWLEANPRRRPRNWKRFMVNWLGKTQNMLERVELREQVRKQEELQKARVGAYRP